MVLLKEDLKDLGHTAYESPDGGTVIVSDGKYLGIERIIIRNVLLQFGDYTIIDEGDVLNTDGTCDWEFTTNFPWSEFCEL